MTRPSRRTLLLFALVMFAIGLFIAGVAIGWSIRAQPAKETSVLFDGVLENISYSPRSPHVLGPESNQSCPPSVCPIPLYPGTDGAPWGGVFRAPVGYQLYLNVTFWSPIQFLNVCAPTGSTDIGPRNSCTAHDLVVAAGTTLGMNPPLVISNPAPDFPHGFYIYVNVSADVAPD